MKQWHPIWVFVWVSLFGVLLTANLKADEWNKKTTLTFSAPIEIPGMVLSPGSYTFKLLDSQSDRHIVQIFNKNETKLYATILAIPDYRLAPKSKTVVTFSERAAGTPEAIREWYYPGDLYGEEFVYPKNRATELAKASKQNVVSMPNEMANNISTPTKTAKEPQVVAMKKAPVAAVNPKGEELEISQAVTPKPPSTAAAPAPERKQVASAELPKTASELPLIALVGLLSLGLAFGLWLTSKRIHNG